MLYAEHNFNASSFTARVVTSTLPDIYNAGAAVIGAFKDPSTPIAPGRGSWPPLAAYAGPAERHLATQRAGARSVVGHVGAGSAGTR